MFSMPLVFRSNGVITTCDGNLKFLQALEHPWAWVIVSFEQRVQIYESLFLRNRGDAEWDVNDFVEILEALSLRFILLVVFIFFPKVLRNSRYNKIGVHGEKNCHGGCRLLQQKMHSLEHLDNCFLRTPIEVVDDYDQGDRRFLASVVLADDFEQRLRNYTTIDEFTVDIVYKHTSLCMTVVYSIEGVILHITVSSGWARTQYATLVINKHRVQTIILKFLSKLYFARRFIFVRILSHLQFFLNLWHEATVWFTNALFPRGCSTQNSISRTQIAPEGDLRKPKTGLWDLALTSWI